MGEKVNMKVNNLQIREYYKQLLQDKDLSLPTEKSWELVQKNNRNRLDYIALSEDEKKITYAEMFEEWRKSAKAYSALGISRNNNSRALVIMPNVASTAIIDYALDMTGAVCDFIDPTTSSDKIIQYIIGENITDIIALDLLFEQNFRKVLPKLKRELGIRNIVLYHETFMNRQLPKKIQRFSAVTHQINRFERDVKRIEDVLRGSQYEQIDYDTLTSDAMSLITHTSGTTTGIGRPIPITDFNRNALLKQHDLAGLVFEPGQKMLHFIPYFASYGAVNTAHLGLYQGMNLQQLPLFQPENFSQYLLRYKPNIVLANDPAWMSLLNDEKLKNADLSFLEQPVSGGTPTDSDKEIELNTFFATHGVNSKLKKGHGLSELCGCGSYTIDGYNHIGGMGVPLPLTTYLIRDTNTGKIIQTTGTDTITGEALINSPNMSSGELDGKKLLTIETIDGKKYLATKDVVRMNPDGSLEFVERLDRMFSRKDAYNIYPINIEKLLDSFEEVEESIVVPKHIKETNSNVPHAYVKLKPEYEDIDLEDFILRKVNEYFIGAKDNHLYRANFRDIPECWTFVDAIPKNTIGKPNLHLVQENGIEGVTIDLAIESDNTGVKSMKIKYPEDSQKVKIK